ncbi:ABC transporter ATP-binding protein [Aerococcaceae bacterium zg-ZJ1578]|uniref:ATP-binding cassette domain-containing protein n=1 Tax=Aerococcaceae bacterium zg-252 TaxID=2796928 RepID=UPI001A2796DB|nr:ABC transporter ATP-binding protein [Aerococcaceae bacterium zg-1578]
MTRIKQHLHVFVRFNLWELLSYGIVIVVLNVLASFLYEPLIDSIGSNQFIQLTMTLIVATIIKLFITRRQMLRKNELNFDIELDQTQSILGKLSQINGDRAITSDIGRWITTTSVDSKQYAYLYTYTLPEIIIGFVGFIGALVFGLSKSITLTVIILSISFVIYSTSKYLSKKVQQTALQEKEEIDNFQPALLSILNGRLLFKAFQRFDFAYRLFEQRFTNYREAQLQRQKARIFLESISMGTGFTLTAIWMSAAFVLIARGNMSIGEFMGFYALDASFNWIFMTFPSLYSAYVEEYVSIDRLESFKAEMFNQATHSPTRNIELETIELAKLDYHYGIDTKEAKSIFNQLDFTLHKGDKIAIRGESGGGKSTLIQILIGYLSQYSGNILVNGQVVVASHLSSIMSYIPQSNFLLNASLRENILLGRPVSEQILNRVCREVGLVSLIDKLSSGLDTMLSSGLQQNLSEGEIQRIGIARALVEEREILILDEPTSALDPHIEQQIVSLLEQLNKTMIMITHRESTVPNGFKQVELHQGKLIQI